MGTMPDEQICLSLQRLLALSEELHGGHVGYALRKASFGLKTLKYDDPLHQGYGFMMDGILGTSMFPLSAALYNLPSLLEKFPELKSWKEFMDAVGVVQDAAKLRPQAIAANLAAHTPCPKCGWANVKQTTREDARCNKCHTTFCVNNYLETFIKTLK
jgi:predicted Zn-ribbon and HTH transcriptional regulator